MIVPDDFQRLMKQAGCGWLSPHEEALFRKATDSFMDLCYHFCAARLVQDGDTERIWTPWKLMVTYEALHAPLNR
jgi:hypothetical protein